jgi:tRNA pseudouridine55 synthase
MDGLLIIDKPAGPTSHDVVARMRRALGQRSVGHTGTLDPAATGVLPLVLGRATRLARFLSADAKSYEAVVRFGFTTDTRDAGGSPLGPRHDGPRPSRDAIEAHLTAFRGTFVQQPPAYSAKKVGGARSYTLARARSRTADAAARTDPPAPLPAPSSVTVYHLDIVSLEPDGVTLHVDCSAGFYVRSLAHDLGERLGVGAHLAALRRTRSGDCRIEDAIPLAAAEADPRQAVDRIIPLARMLPGLAPVVLTPEGVRRATHGRDLGPGDTSSGEPFTLRPPPSALSPQPTREPWVRLLDPLGELVAIARPTEAGGFLHPSVVLV